MALLTLLAVAGCAAPSRDLALADVLPPGDRDWPSTPAYTIFFDLNSALLTPEATAILDRLIAEPARPGWTRVLLAGHADRSGSEQYNRALSAERAEVVRQYLVGAGIADSAIINAAFGERRGLVGTPDGTVEPQNRRVEIYIREN